MTTKATPWKAMWIGCSGSGRGGGYSYSPQFLRYWYAQQGHPRWMLSRKQRVQQFIARRVLPLFVVFDDRGVPW